MTGGGEKGRSEDMHLHLQRDTHGDITPIDYMQDMLYKN